MKEKLKKFWRKAKMAVKEVVETIHDCITDPKNMMATGLTIGLLGLGLGGGLFAGGYLRYKMA